MFMTSSVYIGMFNLMLFLFIPAVFLKLKAQRVLVQESQLMSSAYATFVSFFYVCYHLFGNFEVCGCKGPLCCKSVVHLCPAATDQHQEGCQRIEVYFLLPLIDWKELFQAFHQL